MGKSSKPKGNTGGTSVYDPSAVPAATAAANAAALHNAQLAASKASSANQRAQYAAATTVDPVAPTPAPVIPPNNTTTAEGGSDAQAGVTAQDSTLSAVMRRRGISRGNTLFAGEGGYKAKRLGDASGTKQQTLG